MLDFITRLVQPVVQIKRDEWRKAFPMFLYFSFTIATLYILKPIRSSTFLTSHGAENLRYAYIGEGAFLIFFTFAYIHLSGWFKRRRTFFSTATIFFISNVIGFWFLFHFRMGGWVSFLFYIWVAAYSITIVTQFWTLANDLFDPRQAKRLFGFILSGGSLGGVIGGLLTNRMAERIGTENLLLVVAGLLAVCLALIYFAGAGEKVHHAPAKAHEKSDEITRLQDKSTWKLFFGSRYLLLIVALVMIGKMVSTLIDNQFNAMVENAILEKNARTAFFGGFMAWLNVASFVLQLIVASHVLRGIGVAMSLLLLPIGLGLGSVGTVLFPTLAAAIAIKTYDGSMNYSITQLGKEILYIPIPSSVRYRVKPIIDMLGFRASKSVAGIFIIFVTSLLGIPDEKLGLVVLLVIPLWIVIVWSVRDEYKHAIKKLISSPDEDNQVTAPAPEEFKEVISGLNGAHVSERLKPYVLQHRSSVARKIAGAGCFIAHRHAHDSTRAREMIQRMAAYEALGLKRMDLELLLREEGLVTTGTLGVYLSDKQKTLREAKLGLKTLLINEEQHALVKFSECLGDTHESVRNKRIVILMLSILGTQGAVDCLINHLSLTEDRSLRFNIIRALNQIKSREKRQFAEWTIKKEILNEAKDFLSLQTILRAYKKHSKIPHAEAYLQAVLEALRTENLERIFRLLSLLYSSDIILVIYKRLSDFKSAESFKAHALELLENVVEPRLARVLAPVLEESGLEGAENLEEFLGDFFKQNDPWLAVSAMFLVSELKLERFYHGCRELNHSKLPFVRETAALVLDEIK